MDAIKEIIKQVKKYIFWGEWPSRTYKEYVTWKMQCYLEMEASYIKFIGPQFEFEWFLHTKPSMGESSDGRICMWGEYRKLVNGCTITHKKTMCVKWKYLDTTLRVSTLVSYLTAHFSPFMTRKLVVPSCIIMSLALSRNLQLLAELKLLDWSKATRLSRTVLQDQQRSFLTSSGQGL